MRLSKQTSDAVSILLYCKRSADALVKVGHIAEELGLTKQMALKLANRLSRADLLTTVRGPKGGVRLSEEAKDLPLGQIVRRLESVLHVSEDNPETRPFEPYFDAAFEAFLDVLDQHNLTDLATKRKTKPAKKKPQNKTGRTRVTKSRAASAAQKLRRAKPEQRDRA